MIFSGLSRFVQEVHTRLREKSQKPNQGVHSNSLLISQKSVRGGHNRIIQNPKRTLKVVEHLGRNYVQEEA
jgi:hypothetical protein